MDENHVLTAASCVMNVTDRTLLQSSWFQITAGDPNLFQPSSSREVRSVRQIFPHELYNPVTNANDLAVLRLASPITFPHVSIEPAVFNSRIVPVGTVCQFSGWGTPSNVSLFEIKLSNFNTI